jgi:Zn-dependent protease
VIIDIRHNNFIAIIVCLLIAMTLHEAMHAYTSHWLGDDTALHEGRLSLNPLKHIDPFATVILPAITMLLIGFPILAAKPVPFNPNRVKYEEFGAALVGVAGPLTNLALAILTAIFLHGIGGQLSQSVVNVLGLFVWLNLALFVFNMIPFPPLDGSRLLYAFAPEPLQEVMQSIERYGLMAIVLFIIVAIYFIGPAITNIIGALSHLLGLTFITG